MTAGKVSNYDSEQDHHTERGSRLYGIFSKNVFYQNFDGKRKIRIFELVTVGKIRIFLFPRPAFL